MKKIAAVIRAVALMALFFYGTATIAESAVIRATIKDVNNKPAEGVKIFLYESTNVRKPADFISEVSNIQGKAVVTVPKGKYWAVARLKKGVLYGPLMPGDKHSGEPIEIDCSDDVETNAEFVVADIREVGQKRRTNNAETVRLSGRLLDKDGNPVAHAYAFAHGSREIEYIPEFLSTWTDQSGNYTLYLPSKGRFFVGAAQQFPPVPKPSALKEMVPDPGKLDIATDLILIVH